MLLTITRDSPCWLLLLCASTILAQPTIAQEADSSRPKTVVAGLVTVTNNGISTVPSFTLGKPAAIFNGFIARNNFAFEPEFRWGLNGKPWAFLFWGRYNLPDRGRFHMTIGAHPALNFKTTTDTTNQSERELIVVRRYLAGELYPTYAAAKHVTVGAYYLYSHGFEQDATRNTHFISLRTIFACAPLSDRYFVRLLPQVFYLRQDARDGFYINSALTLGRRNFPFSIATQFNRTIQTSILEGEDFIWNVSLSYSIQ